MFVYIIFVTVRRASLSLSLNYPNSPRTEIANWVHRNAYTRTILLALAHTDTQ